MDPYLEGVDLPIAVKWRVTDRNPIHNVDKLQEPLRQYPFWSFEEAHKFLSWAMRNRAELFPLYHLAYETGLRMGEILALNRECMGLYGLKKKLRGMRLELIRVTPPAP